MEKLDEYKQRHRDWKNISVTQFSNVNNILITLSTGFLAFIITQRKDGIDITINFLLSVDWWVISAFCILLSIAYGIAVLFTRLYDFRISRHIALCRQRFYEERCKECKEKKGIIIKKTLPDKTLKDINSCDRIKTFWKLFYKKIDFISKEDIKKNDDNLKDRFEGLRLQTDILGKSSWRWTKCQVLFFFIGVLTYIINQF